MKKQLLLLLVFFFIIPFTGVIKAQLITPTISETVISYDDVWLVFTPKIYAENMQYDLYVSNTEEGTYTLLSSTEDSLDGALPYLHVNQGYGQTKYYKVKLNHPTLGESNLSVAVEVVTQTESSLFTEDTYYIDATNGDDNNLGTSEEEAWQSISKVNSTNLNPGDRVLFKRGETWSGTMLDIDRPGNSTKNIVFDAYGSGSKPIIKHSGVYVVLFDGGYGNYNVVRNLHIKSNNQIDSTTISLVRFGGTNYSRIENCEVDAEEAFSASNTIWYYGIAPGATSTNIIVRNNYCHDLTVGTRHSTGNSAVIEGILIEFNQSINMNKGNPNDYDAFGGGGLASVGEADDVLFRYNYSYNHGDDGYDIGAATVEHCFIDGCRIDAFAGNGIKMSYTGSSHHSIARYNIIRNLFDDGSLTGNLDGILAYGGGSKQIYGNIIHNVKGNGIYLGFSDGLAFNNISIISSNSFSGRFGLTGNPSNSVVVNNIAKGSNIGISIGGSNNTISNNINANSTNPYFVDLDGLDFRLKDSSSALDAGTTENITWTKTIEGLDVTSNPNIGATSLQSLLETPIQDESQITFDSTSSSGTDSYPVGGYTVSHTIANQPNRYLLASITTRKSSVPSITNSVKYAGQTMIALDSVSYQVQVPGTVYYKQYLFGLANPPAGTNNLVAMYDSPQAQEISVELTSWYNVDQDTPVRELITNSGNSSTPSLTISSASNDLVVNAFSWHHNATITADSNSTIRASLLGGTIYASIVQFSQPGASSVTTGGTLSSSGNWSAIAVSLIPADDLSKKYISKTINPSSYIVYQNYPNPFNPSTRIEYKLPEKGLVTLKIYDILGSEVMTLVNELQDAGSYTLNFNAGNFASGMYIYQLKVNDFVSSKKMLLLK